jgi:CPA2 family monovalent cation:H+ antiporter-2
VLLTLVLVFGQRLMRAGSTMVARRKSAELFMLNVLLITLGLAWLTELAGLSLALGAFLAGMLISETEYRYQVEEDIKPFRDVLLGLFFVTIGMLLDVPQIAATVAAGGGMLAALLAFKLALVGIGLALLGQFAGHGAAQRPVAVRRRRIRLRHPGPQRRREPAARTGVLQPVLAAMVLSLLLAPLIVHFSDRWCCASSPRNGCCVRCS